MDAIEDNKMKNYFGMDEEEGLYFDNEKFKKMLERFKIELPKQSSLETTLAPEHGDLADQSVKHDDLDTPQSSLHKILATLQSIDDRLWDTRVPSRETDGELSDKTVKPSVFVAPTTDDYQTAIRRFLESTGSDYKQMPEYMRSYEESLKRYQNLYSNDHHYSPYHPPQQAFTPPPPSLPRDHPPAISHNWRDHRETPVIKHKHGLQTWHIVIMVVILVAAMVSYACKISSKRSSTPRRRRGAASSGTAQEREPTATAPALDNLYAVVSVPRAISSSHAQQQPTNRRADLQEVNMERIGFVLPEEAAPPPSRPDTPPPPYPGPPLYTRTERHEKPTDPPPPYHAAVKTPT